MFRRGLFGGDIPPFVVGRVFWDNWLVWKALAANHSVIDASGMSPRSFRPKSSCGDGVSPPVLVGRCERNGGRPVLHTGFRARARKPQGASAVSDGKHIVPGISTRGAARGNSKWLLRNGHDLRSSDLRAYLMQWKKAQAQDGFALQAPGRWKYFRDLIGCPWTYGEIMTGRHRVYSYMRACSALVLGYHHLHLFDDARRKRREWMASSGEKTLVAISAKAKAAAATKS